MHDESGPTWFSVEWMHELAPLSRAVGPITYGDLAKLMAMFPEVPDIHRHVSRVAAGALPPLPTDLPAAVVDAVRQLAELNEWAILSVASDPDALLPTGRVPSDLLRGAWDPNEGTFSFGDR